MPILVTIGNLLFSVGLQTLNIFARATVINVAIAAALTVALGVALTTFISAVTNYVAQIALAASSIPAIPYFLPSNIDVCVGAYTAVSVAGLIYRATVRWLENKAYILKA